MKPAASLRPLEGELAEIEADEDRIGKALVREEGAEAGVIGLLNTVFELAGLPLEFDPSLDGEAARLERQKRDQGKEEIADVLRAFRAVTRLYPDILGSSYGGTPEDFEEFRRLVVPQVLEASAKWAARSKYGEDAEQIESVLGRWKSAVD